MSTYEEVLHLAQTLHPNEQSRLLAALATMIYGSVEFEDNDDIISADELAESDLALQAYRSGDDLGLSAADLKLKLFGVSSE
ncbi:MAG: hypothetical protein WBA57_13180 [Elainellaceae cyanobacterium]